MVWYGMVLVPGSCQSRCRPGMVWYGMVWYGMVWYGMVWYGMVWCGVVWCGMVWYGRVWYGMMWCGMVWYLFREAVKVDVAHAGVPGVVQGFLGLVRQHGRACNGAVQLLEDLINGRNFLETRGLCLKTRTRS